MTTSTYFIFDAYGTLFDLSGALAPAKDRLGDKAEAVLSRWRVLQLEYAWLSTLSNRYIDFEVATKNAFTDALAEQSISDNSLIEILLEGFRNVSAYPDAARTLEKLRGNGHTTAILSNGSPSILETAAKSAGLDQHLDRILSVHTAETYKPAPDAYAIATNEFNISPAQAIFVSSNWWDVDGSRAFGYRTVWIDRKTYTWPPSLPLPEHRVNTLYDLTDML